MLASLSQEPAVTGSGSPQLCLVFSHVDSWARGWPLCLRPFCFFVYFLEVFFGEFFVNQ